MPLKLRELRKVTNRSSTTRRFHGLRKMVSLLSLFTFLFCRRTSDPMRAPWWWFVLTENLRKVRKLIVRKIMKNFFVLDRMWMEKFSSQFINSSFPSLQLAAKENGFRDFPDFSRLHSRYYFDISFGFNFIVKTFNFLSPSPYSFTSRFFIAIPFIGKKREKMR